MLTIWLGGRGINPFSVPSPQSTLSYVKWKRVIYGCVSCWVDCVYVCLYNWPVAADPDDVGVRSPNVAAEVRHVHWWLQLFAVFCNHLMILFFIILVDVVMQGRLVASSRLSPELVQVVYLNEFRWEKLWTTLTWTSSGSVPDLRHLLRVNCLNYFSSGTIPELVRMRVVQCSHSSVLLSPELGQ